MKTRRYRGWIFLAVFAGGVFAGRLIPVDILAVLADCVTRPESGDVNGDEIVDISDPVYLLRYLFQAGPAPVTCGPDAEPVSAVIVVRHAERDSGVDALNADGLERADRLRDMLTSLDIDHLIASDLERTKQTLAPTSADHDDLPVEEIDDQAPEEVAPRVLGFPAGSLSVVSHHSYTLHTILMQLGVEESLVDAACFSGSCYDNLFVVLLPTGAPAQFLHLHF